MRQKLVLKWLRWRYGGDVHALKNPLGFPRYYTPSPSQWAGYAFRYWLWLVECRLFERYGQPMRDNWEKSFLVGYAASYDEKDVMGDVLKSLNAHRNV